MKRKEFMEAPVGTVMVDSTGVYVKKTNTTALQVAETDLDNTDLIGSVLNPKKSASDNESLVHIEFAPTWLAEKFQVAQ